jgi:hypothetical protein
VATGTGMSTMGVLYALDRKDGRACRPIIAAGTHLDRVHRAAARAWRVPPRPSVGLPPTAAGCRWYRLGRANRHDSPLLGPTLHAAAIQVGADWPAQVTVNLDAGYDSTTTRILLDGWACTARSPARVSPPRSKSATMGRRAHSWLDERLRQAASLHRPRRQDRRLLPPPRRRVRCCPCPHPRSPRPLPLGHPGPPPDGSAGSGQERQRGHGQGDVPVPGPILADW